jgi:universal stress protein A
MSSVPSSKILAPVDLSSCSRVALEYACKLAHRLGARIEVVFVRPLMGTTLGQESEASRKKELAEARADLHRFVVSTPGTQPAMINEYVETGDVHEQILRAAEAGAFDVLVLGTHGGPGRARSLARSVAESVVRAASCRVITVRAPVLNQSSGVPSFA